MGLSKDPVERVIQQFLIDAGIRYIMDGEGDKRSLGLDFYLPEYDIHIEVKRSHTERTNRQMARVKNIIVIQGLPCAHAFVKIANLGGKMPSQPQPNSNPKGTNQ